MDQSKQPGIQIDQIFLHEAHFTHGKNALSLPPTYRVEGLSLQLQTKFAGKRGERGALVAVRVQTTDPDGAYNIAVEVVMVVSAVPGEENLDPLEYVQRMGPSTLFPFLREAVASLTLKGRFGALWLKPFNFVAAATTPVESGQANALPQPAESTN